MPITVEVCVPDAVSALAAERAGAHRVELCENLSVGGTTPSAGSISVACRETRIPVHVLIRPRAGGFVYSDVEIAVMRQDIVEAKRLGASGVVIGALTPQGSVDRRIVQLLVELARPMSVTFHKAFDFVPEPLLALETVIDVGIDRVLTSGGQPTALAGLPLIAELIRAARGRIRIMAGGRITESDLQSIAAAGVVDEVHIGSAASTVIADSTPSNPAIASQIPLNHGAVNSEALRRIVRSVGVSISVPFQSTEDRS